jgi:hypothetical protein
LRRAVLVEWPFTRANHFDDGTRVSAVDSRTQKAMLVESVGRPGSRISGWLLEDWQSMRPGSGKVRGFSLQLPEDDDHGCEPILQWSFVGAALARNGTTLAVAGGLFCYDQFLEHALLVCEPPSCARPRRIPWGDDLNLHNGGGRTQMHLSADGRYLVLVVYEDCESGLCSHVEVWDLDAGVISARYPAADSATARPPARTTAAP